MTLQIGRTTLTDALHVERIARNSSTDAVGPTGDVIPVNGSRPPPDYQANGRENGSTAAATMLSLEDDRARRGAVYVIDGPGNIPEGYYLLRDAHTTYPGGGPKKRPWDVTLTPQRKPWIARQAEDDNTSGADTADTSGNVDEDAYVDYTTTNAYVSVLNPRSVSGAEKLNLPIGVTGNWKAVLRAFPVTTATALVRWKLVNLSGTVLATGADVAVTPAGAWAEFDLGTLALPTANDKANWYVVEVKDTVNVGSHVRLDRVHLLQV